MPKPIVINTNQKEVDMLVKKYCTPSASVKALMTEFVAEIEAEEQAKRKTKPTK